MTDIEEVIKNADMVNGTIIYQNPNPKEGDLIIDTLYPFEINKLLRNKKLTADDIISIAVHQRLENRDSHKYYVNDSPIQIVHSFMYSILYVMPLPTQSKEVVA